MDYIALRDGLAAAVPFNRTIGLEVLEVGPGMARVLLPDEERLRNHVGTQHASGLFAAAEAASGGAFLAGFAERMGEIRPLAAAAEIEFTKLAKGPIEARAELGDVEALLATLDTEGKVSFEVEVELTNAGGEVVARARVRWHVSKRG
jgi:acyl-coenzyme A thioesterase PaaI-like protein